MRSHVGFVVHFLEPSDLLHLEPAFRCFSRRSYSAFLTRLQDVLHPMVVTEGTVRSPAGASVDVTVVAAPYTSADAMDDMRTKRGRVAKYVREAVTLAGERGCTLVGLGAYNSIVTANGRLVDALGVDITTGNSLAVAASVEALVRTARSAGVSGARLGVVGATGNIGAMAAEYAAPLANEVVLVGPARAHHRLQHLSERLHCPTVVSDDLGALRECTWVLCASNAPEPIVMPEHIGHQPTVVCDLAAPADVHPSVCEARPRATVIQGGLVRLPYGQDLGLEGVRFAPGLIYACMGETILLGLEGMSGHYSLGSLQIEKVRRISALAARHQFEYDAKVMARREAPDTAPERVAV